MAKTVSRPTGQTLSASQILRAFLDRTTCPVPIPSQCLPRGLATGVGQLLRWVNYLVKQSVPTHRPTAFHLFSQSSSHDRCPSGQSEGQNLRTFLGETTCPVPTCDRSSQSGPLSAKVSGPDFNRRRDSPTLPGICFSLLCEKRIPTPALPAGDPFPHRRRPSVSPCGPWPESRRIPSDRFLKDHSST
jgi:hypothetical protein